MGTTAQLSGWHHRNAATARFAGTAGTLTLNSGSVNLNRIVFGNSSGAHSLNVSGTVTSAGVLNVRGRSTLNLESGAAWTQSGSMSIQPQNPSHGAWRR
jgi:hypothetical protein